MTPEGKVTAAQTRYLEKLQKSGEPIEWFKVKGGPMQTTGQPDMLICYNGQMIANEIKAPGEEPTKLQAYRLKEWEKAGAVVGCTHSVEELQALLERSKSAFLDRPVEGIVVKGTMR